MNFLSHYGYFLLLSLGQLLFITPKKIAISIVSISILYFALIAQKTNTNTLFWLQLSAVISMLVCLIYNKKYKYTGVYHIFLLSLGCLLLALQEINQEFVIDIISLFIPTKDANTTMFIADMYYLISLLLVIGAIPFTEWIMYIFSASNSFFKVVCYIVPMFLFLKTTQELSDTISAYSYVVFGSIISIYSGICIIFDNKIRRIFTHIITFFFGMQIMLISNGKNDEMLPLFLVLSLVILGMSHLFTQYRTMIYTLYKIRYFFFANRLYSILSVISFLFIILSFLLYSTIIQNIHPLATTIIICLFLTFIIKILYVCIKPFNKDRNNKTNINIIRSAKMITILLIAFSVLCYKFITNNATFVAPERFEIIIYVISLFIGWLASKLLVKYNRPPFLRSSVYMQFLQNIFYNIRVAGKIVVIAVNDFSQAMYKYFISIIKSSAPQKLTYILYNNNIYFYIFFLIQLLVIITIECIISN